ncbi:MAG: hypothetical protein P8P30_02710 [Rickettsiales bacterium]|nr:hypothetical protein [Rickettsiales bacterium]
MAPKKKYASVKNPTIEAIISENFRFAEPDQAQTRLEALRETFITSRLPEDIDPDPKELKLWIRGYGLSANMREKGYIGNYARFEIKRAEKGKWTLSPVLLSIDKKYHPQRRQPPSRHPNWGHPIMRDIKKNRVHTAVETAQNELARLHELFPEVSIPLTNKMYIMVYQKTDDGLPPIKKWVLEIKATDDGSGFYIDNYPNTYQADAREKAAGASGGTEPPKKQEAVGKFTSAALLKSSRKTAPRIEKKTETEE